MSDWLHPGDPDYPYEEVMGPECGHDSKQVVCGVVRCGRCYEEWLLTAPDRNAERRALKELTEGKFAPEFHGYGNNDLDIETPA